MSLRSFSWLKKKEDQNSGFCHFKVHFKAYYFRNKPKLPLNFCFRNPSYLFTTWPYIPKVSHRLLGTLKKLSHSSQFCISPQVLLPIAVIIQRPLRGASNRHQFLQHSWVHPIRPMEFLCPVCLSIK